MTRALLLVAMLGACRDSKPPEPTPKQRVDAALARIDGIKPKVAKLRGLSFKQPIATASQTSAAFRAFLKREIAKDLPQDKSKRVSAALFQLGLLEQPIELAIAYEHMLLAQAAAYYDPRAKRFFVVRVAERDAELDMMSAHELTHGLQDQHFDLTAYLSPSLDDDALVARQFVTEGDASLTMLLYMSAETTNVQSVSSLIRLTRNDVDQSAAMDLATYRVMMKQQASSFREIEPDLEKSMQAIGDTPTTLIKPLLDSYMKGMLVARTAYEHGGWAAVNALFKDPPTSSEQVLHPATKLFPKREPPIKVTLPALDGELVHSNVLGELQWGVYFSLWTPDLSTSASEGWGGDRYAVVRRADGSLVAYQATIWDTAKDAKQFADAYEASVAKRFPRKDRKHVVKVDALKVFVLDGDDDSKLLDRLVASTKFE